MPVLPSWRSTRRVVRARGQPQPASSRSSDRSAPMSWWTTARSSRATTRSSRSSGVHLQGYLNEFSFRFNRRHSRARGLLFYARSSRRFSTAPFGTESWSRTPGQRSVTDPTGPPRPPGEPGVTTGSPTTEKGVATILTSCGYSGSMDSPSSLIPSGDRPTDPATAGKGHRRDGFAPTDGGAVEAKGLPPLSPFRSKYGLR